MKSQEERDTQSKNTLEHGGQEVRQNKMAGASLPPPPFNLTASPQDNGGGTMQQKPAGDGVAQAAGGFWDTLGDMFGTRDNEAALDLQEDIDDFKSQDYGPMTYTRPTIGGSAFEAAYAPNSDRLSVQVRGKVRFVPGLVDNGGTVSSPNIFMQRGQLITLLNALPALKAQVLPFFQWAPDDREIHKQRFMDNIRATEGLWENTGLTLQVNQPGWEGVTARPDIDIDITEGDAVTVSESYGPFGIFSRIDERGSDHLQVEIVKQLTAADATTVNNMVSNYLQTNLASMPGLAALLTPPAGDATAVRSYQTSDPGARGSNPEAFNNFMSLEGDRSDDSQGHTYEHVVYFDNNSADLNFMEQLRLSIFLGNPSVLLQNPNGQVRVTLNGFASAPGSDEHNAGLVSQRLATVSQLINDRMDARSVNIQTHIDPATQANDSDHSAEADLAANPTTHNPNDWRKVTIKVEQPGRGGQNVLAHEFGHVFGLGDEYAEVGNGYNRPAGALADHDQLAKNAGVPAGAVVGNDNRMMSTGNSVQAAHYSTFADALRQLTSKPWKVV